MDNWRTVEARDLRVGMLTEGAAGAERITLVEWVNDSTIRFVVESGREFVLSYPSHVNVQDHGRDSDCTVGVDGLCEVCGVYHDPANACAECGGVAFHVAGCTEGGR